MEGELLKYYTKTEIPIKIVKCIGVGDKNPTPMHRCGVKRKSGFLKRLFKTAGCLVLTLIVVIFQCQFLTAFEAHIINVRAQLCSFSETRTMGYWKNHPEIYAHYLPQNLGDEIIDTFEKADTVFKNAKASEMRDMLKGQLLAMKFNIAHFGIGEYFVESEGKTLNQIVAEADDLLRQVPEPPKEVLEAMKILLDDLNNLHEIRYCFVPGFTPNIVINEVYYDVDSRTACGPIEEDPLNEWIEIFNPTEKPVDISGWIIEDNSSQNVIPPTPPIPAGGFAVISQASSTWQFWNIPNGAIKIELGSPIGNGLDNDGDRVILKDMDGNVVDAMSYEGDLTIFNPAPPLDGGGNPYNLPDGHSLSRNPDGFDTDQGSDFKDFAMPTPGGKTTIPQVKVYIPNGGEIWFLTHTYSIKWLATSSQNSLLIDIWYSKDSGATWFYKIDGDQPNTGTYNWTIPLDYSLVTTQARIKVLAKDQDGLEGWDMSDCDFCPPTADDIVVKTEEVLAEEMVAGESEDTGTTTQEENEPPDLHIGVEGEMTGGEVGGEGGETFTESTTTDESTTSTTTEFTTSTESTISEVVEQGGSSTEGEGENPAPVPEESLGETPQENPSSPSQEGGSNNNGDNGNETVGEAITQEQTTLPSSDNSGDSLQGGVGSGEVGSDSNGSQSSEGGENAGSASSDSAPSGGTIAE